MALSVALARIWIAGVIGDLRTASRDMTAHGEVEARGSEVNSVPSLVQKSGPYLSGSCMRIVDLILKSID